MTDIEEPLVSLQVAIDGLSVQADDAPRDLDAVWGDLVRGSLNGWVRELGRDLRRARQSLDDASTGKGAAPNDDQISGLEEAFWRLRAATEKVDAVVAVIFGPTGIELYDATARSLRFRPSLDKNSTRLREIGADKALQLREARSALEGERAVLRRHQLIHSLAPLVDLHDLVCYVLVHHRDGRIIPGGYELGRLGPERWNEGVRELRPETLFARRLEEAERALTQTITLVERLADAITEASIVVPQFIYKDAGTGALTLERPDPSGPIPRLEIEFVLGQEPHAVRRVISCSYKMAPGVEITLEDGDWRVIRVADSDGDPIDQIAHCVHLA